MSICSLEPQFYDELIEKLDLDAAEFSRQMDRAAWPAYRERLSALFKQKTRAEWCELLEGSDVCFAPVLSLMEAPDHPHNRARGTFVEHDGVIQPAPAPRFTRTPGAINPRLGHRGLIPRHCWPNLASPPTRSGSWVRPERYSKRDRSRSQTDRSRPSVSCRARTGKAKHGNTLATDTPDRKAGEARDGHQNEKVLQAALE
ncbi:MAG: CoA transferase [Gammaproteobacteria bacterium]|nr:CoA transferase [Gammaproteobacteria bacterium]